jgi:hypothetical protein
MDTHVATGKNKSNLINMKGKKENRDPTRLD